MMDWLFNRIKNVVSCNNLSTILMNYISSIVDYVIDVLIP